MPTVMTDPDDAWARKVGYRLLNFVQHLRVTTVMSAVVESSIRVDGVRDDTGRRGVRVCTPNSTATFFGPCRSTTRAAAAAVLEATGLELST